MLLAVGRGRRSLPRTSRRGVPGSEVWLAEPWRRFRLRVRRGVEFYSLAAVCAASMISVNGEERVLQQPVCGIPLIVRSDVPCRQTSSISLFFLCRVSLSLVA